MTGRARIALATAIAAAAIGAVVALAWGGGDDGGRLAWDGAPRVYRHGKPTDRVLAGRVRNASLRELTLDVADARLLDAHGDEVKGTVRFLSSYVHSLYTWSMRGEDPRDLGTQERTRIGEMAKLKPDQTVPVTLSWRVPEGSDPPVRADFGSVSLALP